MHEDCHDVASCVARIVHYCPVCASHACKAVQKMKLLFVIQQDCPSAIKSLKPPCGVAAAAQKSLLSNAYIQAW